MQLKCGPRHCPGATQIVLRHRRLDLSLAVWRDGRVVLVSPHDVSLPDVPSSDASAR